jgi:Uma2 family endonuclease
MEILELVEHSEVITNFVSTVHGQLKESGYRVYLNNVQYKWNIEGKKKIVAPDASINCSAYLDVPKFVLEVLSPETEEYDRTEKMEIYRQKEVKECWFADWRKRRVEIYTLNRNDTGKLKYYLLDTITEDNKDKLALSCFSCVKISFDELFGNI